MSSSLMVQGTTINNVRPHPNADRLDIAEVLGWQVVVAKGQFQSGEEVVFFPPDTVLPEERAEEFGITGYAHKLQTGGYRLRAAKLRGEPSYGLVVPMPEPPSHIDGDLVLDSWANYFGATKYEPPVRLQVSDAEADHPMFVQYTDVENLRNLPDILQPGEQVLATEKIHGTNARVGFIDGQLMTGSMKVRRRVPILEDEYGAIDEKACKTNVYAYPLIAPGVYEMLKYVRGDSREPRIHFHNQVILFGEVYGSKIQTLGYGLSGSDLGFRAFDLLIDGHYMDHYNFYALAERFGVEVAPVVYVGPYSLDEIKKVANGKSVLDGANHTREGVVVRPEQERQDPRVGRVILKYHADAYLTGNYTDYTEE